MPRCQNVQRYLTAWVDGELSDRWKARVESHLEKCPRCLTEADSIRAAVQQQRALLLRAAVVEGVDTDRLRVQLRRQIATEAEQPAIGWGWLLRPLGFAGGAAAVAMLLVFALAGGPGAVLIPLGVESPPRAVTREPELFRDYLLIQHLDALENFDTVESVPLDDELGTGNG
jgi:anti-sigma factor RsiW